MGYGLLIDTTFCVGCEKCLEACKKQNNLPEKIDNTLTAYTWTTLEKHDKPDGGKTFVRRLCMHCEQPACASVCPVGAFTKTELGAVIYRDERCIGCRYCMVACPFSIPKYQWDKALPLVQKCILCFERIKDGMLPACAEACPTEATLFGEREKLITIAKMRIQKYPDRYHNYIYGLEEVGGTGVLYISDVPFEKLGFRTDLIKKPLPSLTAGVMSLVPNIVSLGGVALFGTYWIINRRIKLAREKLEMEKAEENEK